MFSQETGALPSAAGRTPLKPSISLATLGSMGAVVLPDSVGTEDAAGGAGRARLYKFLTIPEQYPVTAERQIKLCQTAKFSRYAAAGQQCRFAVN
jgi:hypothetical protein